MAHGMADLHAFQLTNSFQSAVESVLHVGDVVEMLQKSFVVLELSVIVTFSDDEQCRFEASQPRPSQITMYQLYSLTVISHLIEFLVVAAAFRLKDLSRGLAMRRTIG